MSQELWATYSVKDHRTPRALAADIILFDRLVFPAPEIARPQGPEHEPGPVAHSGFAGLCHGRRRGRIFLPQHHGDRARPADPARWTAAAWRRGSVGAGLGILRAGPGRSQHFGREAVEGKA